jgi:hypothetical protein
LSFDSGSSSLESPKVVSLSEVSSPGVVTSVVVSVSSDDLGASAVSSQTESPHSEFLLADGDLSSESDDHSLSSDDDSLESGLVDSVSTSGSVSLDDVLPSETLAGSIHLSVSDASSVSVVSDTVSSRWVDLVGSASSVLVTSVRVNNGVSSLDINSVLVIGDDGVSDGPLPGVSVSSARVESSETSLVVSLVVTDSSPGSASVDPDLLGSDDSLLFSGWSPSGGSVGNGNSGRGRTSGDLDWSNWSNWSNWSDIASAA